MGQKQNNWPRAPRRNSERGQVAILFALVFTFMFVLFCFVINFAHLVNTKINLQLSADAAAYAGAAWQARTLNKIGLVNYRMRQNVKELAMKLQVTHLRHNRNYPRGAGVGVEAPPQVEPFLCQQAHGYRALSGLRYANDTNLCRNASPTTGGLPPIIVPPVIANFDPFAVAIAAQIRRIADEANRECRAAADDNREMANHLVGVYQQRQQFHRAQIDTLRDFLNEAASGGYQNIDNNNDHPIKKIAWNSFLKNLVGTNFLDNASLDIVPVRGGSVVEVDPVNMNGSVFFMNFNVRGDGCVGLPSFREFEMPAGVTKRQEIVTYFAVRARVRPKLFFMPAAWAGVFPELIAFSAAKPFGSRIGPGPNFDILLPVADRPGNNNKIVNFSFFPGDQLGLLSQNRMSVLDRMHPVNAVGRPDGNQQTGWPDETGGAPKVALQAIRAPTVFDALFFPIFPDPSSAANYEESDIATLLFPDNMEASDADGGAIAPTGNSVAGKPGVVAITAPPGGGGAYGNYATEGTGSHSIPLGQQVPEIGGNATALGWATREMVHSGWAPPGGARRIGYSVKIVSFDTISRATVVRGSGGGGQTRIQNVPEPVEPALLPGVMLH